MTTNYFKINPPTGEAQEIGLPIDSIIYFAISKEDFPDIWLPMLFLDDTWQGQNGLTWLNYDGYTAGAIYYPQPWEKNNLVTTRFWTGYVPFESTINAQIKGFNKVIGGNDPISATRTTYQTSSGDTFYTDTWTQNITIDFWYLRGQETQHGSSQSQDVEHYIVRDSNMNQIGGYTRTSYFTTVKVGSRRINVTGIMRYTPITRFGTLPVKPNTTSIPSRGIPEYDESEATPVGESETVSITDYFTFTPATPITIPMHFNCTDKSYSYIIV